MRCGWLLPHDPCLARGAGTVGDLEDLGDLGTLEIEIPPFLAHPWQGPSCQSLLAT